MGNVILLKEHTLLADAQYQTSSEKAVHTEWVLVSHQKAPDNRRSLLNVM